MTYLSSSYDPWVVLASVAIGALASYVALDLAKRVHTPDRVVALIWWVGGSLVMGTGIWSMHFVGMLAYSSPVALGYRVGLTVLSWLAGVAVSAVALWVASRGLLTTQRLAVGAVVMGAGICTMHYTGMEALDMMPSIVWNRWLVAASALIAVGASAAALIIFSWLSQARDARVTLYQVAAAVVMGLAISGMHYTGMAAANFPVGSVCLSANALGGGSLGRLVGISTVLLLALTLAMSMLDVRQRLTQSLKQANLQLQAANDELKKRTLLDPLTGLPNRVLFEDRLKHALARLERSLAGKAERGSVTQVAVLFVDLDGFKPVNDSFGHAAGDRVLTEVAARLSVTARDSDTVARLGGDEFVLLVEDARSPADCVQLAGRLLEALSRPFNVLGNTVEISASIGMAIYPEHGDKDKLLAQADAAMYVAKRDGGAGYALFEPHMDAGAREQLSLQIDLRHAVERGQMQLHFQPKLSGRGGAVTGVEALLRWRHPERGWVSPEVFIPMAERFGLINGLGDWVINEACRHMRAWADQGLRLSVAVNLSAHQLREHDLVERIGQALQRQRLEPSQLLCEITETAAMQDIDAAKRVFAQMANLGVFLSIDDFGTGYSSLSYLRQLPACQLKIDRSFVKDLEASTDARAVVDAVIHLAHALSLSVVAEGVETEGQRDILRTLGCDELQGYLFARPMAADALAAWINLQTAVDRFNPLANAHAY